MIAANDQCGLNATRSQHRNKAVLKQENENQSENSLFILLRLCYENPKKPVVLASWRSGYAADCKSVYRSSILLLASKALCKISGLQILDLRKIRYTVIAQVDCAISSVFLVPKT